MCSIIYKNEAFRDCADVPTLDSSFSSQSAGNDYVCRLFGIQIDRNPQQHANSFTLHDYRKITHCIQSEHFPTPAQIFHEPANTIGISLRVHAGNKRKLPLGSLTRISYVSFSITDKNSFESGASMVIRAPVVG